MIINNNGILDIRTDSKDNWQSINPILNNKELVAEKLGGGNTLKAR